VNAFIGLYLRLSPSGIDFPEEPTLVFLFKDLFTPMSERIRKPQTTESDRNFLVKGVDEEFKKLVLVYFIIRLLGIRHIVSKQTSQLTGFVMY